MNIYTQVKTIIF